MEKIKFQSPDGTVEEFYIEEQTMIGGEVPKYVKKYTKEMYATLLLPAGLTSCSV